MSKENQIRFDDKVDFEKKNRQPNRKLKQKKNILHE